MRSLPSIECPWSHFTFFFTAFSIRFLIFWRVNLPKFLLVHCDWLCKLFLEWYCYLLSLHVQDKSTSEVQSNKLCMWTFRKPMTESGVAQKYVKLVHNMNERNMRVVTCAVRVTDGFWVDCGMASSFGYGYLLVCDGAPRNIQKFRSHSVTSASCVTLQ